MSSSAPNIAVFAPVLRSPRLTMTLFNRETDLQFLLDLFNASRSQLPTDPPLKEEDILRLNRNFTLSPKNCLGLTPTDVAVRISIMFTWTHFSREVRGECGILIGGLI
jgi:hypothetical protein